MNRAIVENLLAQEPGRKILNALRNLFDRDGELLELDVNERSICHRLAMHLQAEIPDLHVDCEYNRDGVNPKRIQYLGLNPDADDTEAKTVFPDIIVHKRKSKINYLVVELKKSTNSVDRDVDLAKLRGYKSDLGFEFALFLELVTDATPDVFRAEWVN